MPVASLSVIIMKNVLDIAKCPLVGRKLFLPNSTALVLNCLVNSNLASSRFPGGSDSKEFACNMGDWGSISELGRSPGGGNGNPLQYSCLESPVDRGAWRATVHGVTEPDMNWVINSVTNTHTDHIRLMSRRYWFHKPAKFIVLYFYYLIGIVI